MNSLDFSPLFRTAIGFDRLARLVDTARTAAEAPSYPPYNIERTADDAYTLTMAVAGVIGQALSHRQILTSIMAVRVAALVGVPQRLVADLEARGSATVWRPGRKLQRMR